MPPISLCGLSFHNGIIAGNVSLKMATLSVIPYTYKPHKIRRKDHGAKNRLEGGDDFPPASEIRQTTLNIHNSEDESQIDGSALDGTPSLSDLCNSTVHDSLGGSQGRHATPQSCKSLANIIYIARPIDLENDHGNFISATTHVSADNEDSGHGIDERSPVTRESGGYDIGTDQEPASKEASTLNSVGSPICSPHGFDVLPFAQSPTSWDGGDSIAAREPEISYLDGFSKLDEEDQQENESVPEGCSIVVEPDEAHGGMRPCNKTPKVHGDNTMKKASLAARREGTNNTQGCRYPKRHRASIVNKTARQSPSKRQRLSPPDLENDSSSSEDDDEDDANYEHNESCYDDHPACDSDERPVQRVCDDDIVNPEMLIPVYIPQKYLRYLALQPRVHSATTGVKSRNLKRKPASVKATRTRYTEHDDKQLLELKEERGMSWPEIQKEYFPERVINSLQVHYCTKVKPRRQKNHVLHA
jgi:hypothetical protein